MKSYIDKLIETESKIGITRGLKKGGVVFFMGIDFLLEMMKKF